VKRFVGVAGTIQSMIAWESSDFLTSDRKVESLTVGYTSRGETTTGHYLIETAAGWYQSDQAIAGAWAETTDAIGDLTWSSYSLFGVTGGGAVAVDTTNVLSVGAYFTSTGVNWTGVQVEYFKVTAPGGVNPPPVAEAKSVDVVQNSFVNITLTGSPDGSLTYSVEDTPANGVLTGTAPDLTYTPDTDYTGPDRFTFTVNDGDTNSALATVSIDVSPAGTTDLGAIWFIGDSITQSNADGDSAGSPRKSLYDLLTANGYLFTYTGHFTANVDGLPATGATAADNLYHYHSGISGSVIGDDYSGRWGMTENLSAFWNSGRLAEVKPDVILIMLGANDVNLALDLPGAPDRLKTLVQNIYELPGAGNPTVFLATITPNRTDEPQDPINVAAFNAAVPGVVANLIAQGRDVRLVDQFTPINNDYATNMRPDNLHPNATGNDVMAQQWYNAMTETWPGTVSDFHSFDLYTFTINGLNCKVAVPDVVAEGRPWIWRARFWDHQSGPDVALLSNGFHVAYVDVADLFGSPTAVARFDSFYGFLTQTYGLDHQVALEGMSRGGLIIYNWARENTDKVHCVYADAPVCDFKSWPGGFYDGDGNSAEWIDCKDAYGFASDEDALAYGGNPVDNMQPLADAGIPLLHVVGDADTVVPVAENTAIVETNYLGFGGAIKVIHKPGVGHVHGLADPTPIIDFILNAVSADLHVPGFVPGITLTNGNFNVQFTGTTGQHYRVETETDITATHAWTVVTDLVSLPTSPMQVSAPMTNDAGFYRLVWLPWQ